MITNERIIEIAIQSGLTCYGGSKQSSGHHSWHAYTPHIEAFARAIAKEQMECDAKMFDGAVWSYDYREIAAAIRNQVRQDEPKVEG